MRRAFGIVALALAGALSGCTPQGLWGSEARYAPDIHGYVIAKSPESDRRFSLVNPVTRKKLRCREDVEALLPPLTRAGATLVHDQSVGPAAAAPLGVTLAPLSVPGFLLYLSGSMVSAVPDLVYEVAKSPGARTLYEEGLRAFDTHDDGRAERLLELALLKTQGSEVGADVARAGYFLGILYEREHRTSDAARAFQAFVERAQVRDAAAYDKAEGHLLALVPSALKPCRSQAPLPFVWPPPGMVPPARRAGPSPARG